jgi:integrase
MNWGVLEGKLKENPLRRVQKPKISEKIRDYFSEEEFLYLFIRMPENTYIERTAKFASLLAYATGARIGEICNIQLNHIKWNRQELHFTNSESFHTKNRKARIIPLTPRIIEAIKHQFQNKASHSKEIVRESIYLFPNEVGKPFSNEKNKCCKLSKIFTHACRQCFPDRPGLHFHSLRHSLGQNAYNTGVPIVQISKLLGHKNEYVTANYYARQADYKNMKEAHSYLEHQPTLIQGSTLSTKENIISGSITEKELLECVHSDSTTLG